MSIRTRHLEDYVLGEARETFGRTITETDFVVHAGHTGDFFPHHVDAEFAKTLPGGQRIAHGTMVFAIGIGLTASEINPVAFSYGYDKLRFVKPVVIGDTIRSKVSNTDVQPDPKRPGFGRVTEHVDIVNQRGETVLVCDHLHLVESKAKAA
jgi:monoamine oxidase